VFSYYVAFEYYRYKMARMMALGLGGSAVFRLGSSYMRRYHSGVEERAWIVPDDKMAWGSVLSILTLSESMLFMRRDADPGFRFNIEPRKGSLLRSVSLGCLKDADFHVPQLDKDLRLRTSKHVEAVTYFGTPERQQATSALFLAGATKLKSDHGAIVATMKGIAAEDLNPGRIDDYLRYLRAF
jgi:hypothetical protein